MTVVPDDSIGMLLLSSSVLLVIGIILLKFGLWPRRRGDTPYCRKCGYNLTGTEGDRCSECGTTLTADTIVHGQRRRRRLVVAAGVLLILLAGVPASLTLRQVNWYRLRPTAWVMSDFRSTVTADQQRAWNELMRRARADMLSDAQHDQFIRLCLIEQAAQPASRWTRPAFYYLIDCWRSGVLTTVQEQQFFEQMVLKCDVEVKPTGDGRGFYNIDLVMRNMGRDLGRKHDFRFRLREGTAIDRAEPAEWRPWRSETINAFDWGRGTNGISLNASPGDHTLRYLVEVEVYTDGPVGDLEGSRLCHSFRVEDSENFTVNPDGTVAPMADE